MRVATIVGTRPQFIKAAPVSLAFARRSGAEQILIHTGQHFDANMSGIFFEELGIPGAHHNLGISSLSHGAMTGRMLEALESVLIAEKPDWVLVFGDTNSTMAGALAAAKLRIRVAHVEAGLRSFNRSMPEEINRVLTDHCSDLLFTPSETATRNLANEGVAPGMVSQVGDVMQDSVNLFRGAAQTRSVILAQLGLRHQRYVLATVHRQENTDDPARLAAIVDGLSRVARELPVVLPLHPRTRDRMDLARLSAGPGVRLIAPLGYLDMIALQRGACVVATDSGGLQKEAYFHRVPCVTLRDETEWVELVESGWNRLCSPSRGAAEISAAVLGAVGTSAREEALYGNGDAADLIVDRLVAASESSSA